MASRYFQISKHDRVVSLKEESGDIVEFKFQKLGRNFASGGFNGFLEIQDNDEAADLLAANATKFGAWEITEADAIVEVQKKRSSINRVEYRSDPNQQNVNRVEARAEEPEVTVDSVDELMSGPEPEPVAVEEPIVETAPEPVKPKAKPRKARKTSKK